MAFKKVGDASPILGYYDADGVGEKCPKCGKNLIIIAIDQDHNKLVCECCDVVDVAGEPDND
jgi:ssDNA-binding Zn-finger/Zn-ribbon topoisomerase 1